MKELALTFPLRLCQFALNPSPQARRCENWAVAPFNPEKGRQEPSQVTLKQRQAVWLIRALWHLTGGNGSLKSKSITFPGRWISQTVWAKGVQGCWWIGLGLQWITIARKGFPVIGFLVPSPKNYFIYGCNKQKIGVFCGLAGYGKQHVTLWFTIKMVQYVSNHSFPFLSLKKLQNLKVGREFSNHLSGDKCWKGHNPL